MFEPVEDNSGIDDSGDLIQSGRLWKRKENTDQMISAAMYQLEPELFKHYRLIPLAAKLYDTLNSDTKETAIGKLIDEMDMEFDVEEDGSQTGGMTAMDEYFFVLESISDFSIFDAVPEAFSEEQTRILGFNGFLKHGGSKIELKQLEEKGLLQCLGIYERLEAMWDGICRWRTEGEANGWC